MGGGEALITDLADADATREAASRAGRVDLLVNNAGISIPRAFLDTTAEAFDATLGLKEYANRGQPFAMWREETDVTRLERA
jgi:NAD(P)-dependent dehydrogenase (short-subunit alcohol dehydrogenase family)